MIRFSMVLLELFLALMHNSLYEEHLYSLTKSFNLDLMRYALLSFKWIPEMSKIYFDISFISLVAIFVMSPQSSALCIGPFLVRVIYL